MNFKTLQQRLRSHLLDRIASGEFTGVSLAARTGFRQAHISNFLNQRRALSLDAMDQVLKSLHLSLLDLLAPDLRPSVSAANDKDFETIPLVPMACAATSRVISAEDSLDYLKFKKNFLRRLRPDCDDQRRLWTRFVIVKSDSANADAMYPRLQTGATLLIDRQYNSLRPYRRSEQNMYLVRKGSACLVRYAALHGDQLSLRPQGEMVPLDFVKIPAGADPADFIIGRICHVGIET